MLGGKHEQRPLLSCSEHDIDPGTAQRLGYLPVVSQQGGGEKRASALPPVFPRRAAKGCGGLVVHGVLLSSSFLLGTRKSGESREVTEAPQQMLYG